MRATEKTPGAINDNLQSETLGRCNGLRLMLGGSQLQPRDTLRPRLSASDSTLNTVYQKCLARLNPEGQSRLREARRAWLAFRDENARAKSEYALPGQALAASLQVTMRRSVQMGAIYLGSPVVSSLPAVDSPKMPAVTETPDPSIPDPFASAR